MKILVCFKILPNPDRVLTEDWDSFSLSTDLRYAGMDFNCFDQSALELGLQIKEQMAVQGAEASCTAVTVSDTMPETLFSNLYAVGYDRVLCIPDRHREFCPQRIAAALAELAEEEKPDLILTGTQAGMSQTGMVPYLMGSRLHLPVLGEAEQLSWRDSVLTVRSRREEGLVEQQAALPVICAVGNSPEVLRFAGLRERMLCRSKKAELLPEIPDRAGDSEPQLTRPDTGRRCTLLDGEDPDSLNKIMDLLRKAAGTGETRKSGAEGLSPEEQELMSRCGRRVLPPASGVGEAEALAQLREIPVLLLPDTVAGRSLCAALALEQNRTPFFGGRITGVSPECVTVQKRVCASNLEWTEHLSVPAVLTLSEEERERLDQVEEYALPSAEEGEALLPEARRIEPAEHSGLRSAPLVVICGCGMKKKENVDRARVLAERLGAGFGLTRPAALNAWGSSAEIVGQSGSVLSPKCVLVLGAAGAGAFLAGIEHAETIIAVNTDPEALIFQNADLGLETDASALTEGLLNLC